MPGPTRTRRKPPAPAWPLAACLLAACVSTLGGCALLRPEQPTPELRRQAGQMLLVGFRGAEPVASPFDSLPGSLPDASQPDSLSGPLHDDLPVPLPILGQIAGLNLGGVILFDRDAALKSPQRNIQSPEQLRRLTSALQAAAAAAGSPPLFIAVDQEGGRVQRLKAERGFTETPPAADLCPAPDPAGSETTTPSPALAAGKAVGAALAAVGVNLDFAPVADVNVNPQNPVIGALGAQLL